MKKAYTPVRNTVLLLSLFSLLAFAACKKKKDDEPNLPGNATIQIILPAGSPVDVSKTTVVSLSKAFSVGSDGKTTVLYNPGTYEQVFLFDENKKLMMAGFVSDENKEISIATTAQVLLYYGLNVTYTATTDTLRTAAIKRIPTYPQFANYKAKLEQLFAADPLMLSKGHYFNEHVKTVNAITYTPVIDLFGKQIKVEDADPTKGGITVTATPGDDESITVRNAYARRGHAFLYKKSYVDNTNITYNPLLHITSNTPATDNFAVLGSGPSPAKALPLESYEKESTWKVRIVGVGKNEVNADEPMTNAESAKLEEMWYEFFACDILMPCILDVLNQKYFQLKYNVIPNNIEMVRPFINEVKARVQPSTMNLIKAGKFKEGMLDFKQTVLFAPLQRQGLYNKLRDCIDQVSTQEVPVMSDIEAIDEYNGGIVDLAYAAEFGRPSNESAEQMEKTIDFFYQNYWDNSNKMDEWTVKSKDNDATITPKHSQTMRFTNYVLTASATADLATGESISYTWTTPGNFGGLKETTSSTPANTVSTANTTVIYYGSVVPNADNIEKVYLTAYITGPSGTREIGRDTATINVKKVLMVMEPSPAELTPREGTKSIQLYVQNADGTNPMIQGNGVQYKAEWSTAGSYGDFGGNTQVTTAHNSLTYTATDENVLSATETITVNVYFKLSSTGWILMQKVTGTVKIINDPKIKIYYTAPQGYTTLGPNYHAEGCGVYVPKEEYAISYDVLVTNIVNVNPAYNPYHDTWTANDPSHVRGYMGYVISDNNAVGDDYLTGVYGTFSWGNCNGCIQNKPDCTGTARVKILLSQ